MPLLATLLRPSQCLKKTNASAHLAFSEAKSSSVQAAVRRLKPIGNFVHTITFDDGKEFAAHQDIAHALKTKIFFANIEAASTGSSRARGERSVVCLGFMRTRIFDSVRNRPKRFGERTAEVGDHGRPWRLARVSITSP